MRRTLCTCICIAFALLGPAVALECRADVVVVVHPENPLLAATPKEVSDLYLGRSRTFSTSLPATIYEHPPESPLRDAFFRGLNGMSIKQLNAYWARLRFSGEVLPPTALPNSRAVIDHVRRDRTAIGYVHSSEASDSVRIVLRLKE